MVTFIDYDDKLVVYLIGKTAEVFFNTGLGIANQFYHSLCKNCRRLFCIAQFTLTQVSQDLVLRRGRHLQLLLGSAVKSRFCSSLYTLWITEQSE
jgi:hypothetical protein